MLNFGPCILRLHCICHLLHSILRLPATTSVRSQDGAGAGVTSTANAIAAATSSTSGRLDKWPKRPAATPPGSAASCCHQRRRHIIQSRAGSDAGVRTAAATSGTSSSEHLPRAKPQQPRHSAPASVLDKQSQVSSVLILNLSSF